MAELKIQFLDVGQGDGMFIEFPGGATMLVDLGTTKNKGVTSPDILKYFKDHTKFGTEGETLDYLILTHGDQDHFNMVRAFIEDRKVKVARLLFSGSPADYTLTKQKVNEIDRIKALCPAVQIVSPKNIPARLPSPTGNSTFGEVEVHVIAANVPGTSKTDKAWRKNTGSVVLMLVYGIVRVILAGDATSDTEKFISALFKYSKSALSSHILKLGHHGSRRTSNTVQWIQDVSPAFVFISADRHGSLGDKTKSGHRLPQTLTLSLIEKHSPYLYNKCVPHNVISAFDSDDYDKYNQNPDIPQDNVTYNVPGKRWAEGTTNLGVFTSLVAMDMSQPDASDVDQGAQYQLSISDQNVIEVTSSWGMGVLARFQV